MNTRGRFDLRMLAVAVVAGGLATAVGAQERSNQFSDEEEEVQEEVTESTPSSGGGDLIDGKSFDAMIASFDRNGFSVELTEDSEGAPKLRSTDKDEPFSVYFYNCTDNADCGVIVFNAGWNLDSGITLAKIEEWNANKIWAQASRDDDKDPWISLGVNLRGGVSVENFDDTVEWWRYFLREFEEHIGWEAE